MKQESDILFPSLSTRVKLSGMVLMLCLFCLGGYLYEKNNTSPPFTGLVTHSGKVFYFHNGIGGELS